MKVDYKTHPILEKLERRSLGVLPIFKDDARLLMMPDFVKILAESFKENVGNFENIIYVSKEYYDSSIKVRGKLLALFKDIVLNCIDDIRINGTFIVGDKVCFIKQNLLKSSEEHHMVFFCFHKSGMPLAFYETGNPKREGTLMWVSNAAKTGKDEKAIQEFVAEIMADVSVIHLFKSYAQVETKFVAAKSKIKSGLERHLNDTKLDITYLTSKWFTNIVRSEGFSVSGHFRLQPKKVNGEWTKELIWINPFKKHGYHSRAAINIKQ